MSERRASSNVITDDLEAAPRRMLVDDGHGLTVDMSSECAPDPEWMKRVRPAEGGGYVEG